MKDPSSEDIQKTLQDLNPSSFPGRRLRAISILDRLPETNAEIVEALAVVAATDSDLGVRSAAIIALQAPVHQAFLKENPGFLQKATENAVRTRQQDQEEEDNQTIAEFKRRLNLEKRTYVVFLLSIFLMFAAFVFIATRDAYGSSKSLVYLFQVSVFAMAGFFFWRSWKNWRCPACNSWLGGFKAGINVWFASSPTRCPHCGIKLL